MADAAGDSRLIPARPDVAAAHLKGRVTAERFVEGRVMRVREPATGLWRAPRSDRGRDSELLHGEVFTVYDAREGWAWGQSALDGYVGYVAEHALVLAGGWSASHKVGVPLTLVFPEPDVKVTPVSALSREARVRVVADEETDFVRLDDGGFVPARHLAPLGIGVASPAAVAAEFLGVPYLWGGRTALGLDCSALIQLAFAAAGIGLPRDTDLQARVPAMEVPPQDLAADDLVFWDGHVGVMLDRDRLVHANAYHMAVVVEPLAEAVMRIAPFAGAVTALRRLPRPV